MDIKILLEYIASVFRVQMIALRFFIKILLEYIASVFRVQMIAVRFFSLDNTDM